MADWGNAQLWAPYTYDYFARSDRDRRTGSLEVRLASAAPKQQGDIAWLVGVYGLRMSEDGRDTSEGIYEDPFFPDFNGTLDEFLDSRYRSHSEAVFGQLDGLFTDRLHWSAGVRAERRKSEYQDSGVWQGAARVSGLDSSNNMVGGQLTLSFDISKASTAYASVSRGYKAGGFNLGDVPQDRLQFRPEFLWNYEMGVKQSWMDGRLYADTSVFYSRRRDVQVRTGDQLDPSDPTTFVFFTDNASAGYNYGLEASTALADQRTVGRQRIARTAAHAIPQLQPGRCSAARSRAGARAEVSGGPEPRLAPSHRLERACHGDRPRCVLLRRAAERFALESVRAHESAARLPLRALGCVPVGPQCVRSQRTPSAASSSAMCRRTSRISCTFSAAIRARSASRSTTPSGEPMEIGIEMSLYPLNADFIPPIQDFIDRLNARARFKVVTNSMSTQVFGEFDDVFGVLVPEMKKTFETNAKAVFVMKVLGPLTPAS